MDGRQRSDDSLFGNPALPERFWSKVDADRIGTGCWVWTAGKSVEGYGHTRWSGSSLRAHRLAYSALVGTIPDGLHMDHLCRNPPCVNPMHLEPVTCKENLLRGYGFGAKNARKKQCPRGHTLEGDNLFLNKAGRRVCLTCKRAATRTYMARKRAERGPLPPRPLRTRCLHGHELTTANVYVPPGTQYRYCLECIRQAERRRAKRRQR